MAGLETAWLFDGIHTVTLMERDDVIGGHAKTVSVTVGDSEHWVDVGAQYFSERRYPNFWKLVTSTLRVPVVPATMTIAMWEPRAASRSRRSILRPASTTRWRCCRSRPRLRPTGPGPTVAAPGAGTPPSSNTSSRWTFPPSIEGPLHLSPAGCAERDIDRREQGRGGPRWSGLPRPPDRPRRSVGRHLPQRHAMACEAVADALIDQLTTTDVHVSAGGRRSHQVR